SRFAQPGDHRSPRVLDLQATELRRERKLMPSDEGTPRGYSATRFITFYAVLALLTAAVVVYVFGKGHKEKPLPSIAGGYVASASTPCLGPVPTPAGGTPLPSTAPAQPKTPGPLFNVLQSGEFVNFTNNQGTLSGQLRLKTRSLPGGGHRL